jgi:dTDP-4-amino-4,6-dideoxygalactose transaminase
LLPENSPVGRDDLMVRLADADISARRGIMAAHLEPAYAQERVSLPVTERLTRNSLVLPLYHQMTESDQDRVVGVLVDALQPGPRATVPR